MADDQKAEISAVNDTQPEPVPSSEQQTTKPVETAEVVEETPEAKPVKAEEDLKLPEDAKERTTQQFEKLKRELAQERERRSRLERSFATNQPSTAPSTLPEWYDPKTGEVDVAKLQEREQLMQTKITKMESQLSGVTRVSEKKQEEEAYAAYPELNPNRKDFNEDFQKQVISHLATEYAEGKAPSIKEAADNIMRIAEKVAKKAEKEGAKKALESLSPKEQAALEATGRSDKRLPSVDYGAIRAQTRTGGRTGAEAIMQRLSKISSVGK